MAKENEVYKCSVCGNIVSVVTAESGELVCCGKPMDVLKTIDPKFEGKEKHVPVIEFEDKIIRVKLGSIPHPMVDDHFIELIQVLKDDVVIFEKRLKPNQDPVAEFGFDGSSEGISARALCNIHGFWKSA